MNILLPNAGFPIEQEPFGHRNVLKRILKKALMLFNARQTCIIYGTDKSLSRFLPTEQWDRGVMDRLEAKGLQGLLFKGFGARLVKARGLSPIMLNTRTEYGIVENQGMIAHVLRTCESFYRNGVQALIFPDIRAALPTATEKPDRNIVFFSYTGKGFLQPDDYPILADTGLMDYLQASNFISVYLPDYGILIINTADKYLLERRNSGFVREPELKQQLDMLIDLVKTASLAYLGHLKGKQGVLLLRRKEKKLRRTALELDHREQVLKQTELAVAQNREKYRELYENASNAYIITDSEFVITGYNQTVNRLLGYDSSALLGRKITCLFADTAETRMKTSNIEQPLARNCPVKAIEVQVINVQGELIWVSLSIDPVLTPGGKPAGTRAMLMDISDRKRLERQLIQAQKMEAIGTLAGGIAHDFNNILFPIIGYTEMLLEDYANDDAITASLEKILYGANRARDLISQILTFSREKENQLSSQRLQHSLKEITKLIRSVLPSTIQVVQTIDPNVRPVMADPTQIHQVVMNLVTNAFHSMEESGGRLIIGLNEIVVPDDGTGHDSVPEGTYACISISDTGTGMDPNLIRRIFDPYFTTKQEGKGTGLGLSVVHGIVKAHGGHITVASKRDHGSTFSVYFPISARDIQSTDSLIPKESPLVRKGKERVLLVDDSQEVVTMLHFFLEKQGYQVTDCINSLEALTLFRKCPQAFDLVITDLTMPGMTGDDLSREILAVRPDIPIILCTGFSNLISEEKAAGAGIRGFVHKPVNTGQLAGLIRSILDSGPVSQPVQ